MKIGIEGKRIAAGVAGAVIVAGSGPVAHAEVPTYRVGESEWVQYKTGYPEETNKEPCVMKRGAKLIFQEDRRAMVYSSDETGGTLCPDGAKVILSQWQAVATDKRYWAYEARRQDVISQVKDMTQPVGMPTDGPDTWVDSVNSTPIKQLYSNGYTPLEYGDSCIADNTVQEMGRLVTGETVMRVIDNQQLGTDCPTGTLYLNK